MTVILSSEAKAEIRRRIDRGRYPDAAAVIDGVRHARDQQEEVRLAKLRKLVLAGFDSGDGG